MNGDRASATTEYRPIILKWVERCNIKWEDKRKWRVNIDYGVEIEGGLEGK
ncbi:hypothetical protein L479_02050 [Exiguobacterium sp. S17]|nr:hypothetical protein L479_02050 [Exiguobacterium sp. S17]